jgi:hypothetical protein
MEIDLDKYKSFVELVGDSEDNIKEFTNVLTDEELKTIQEYCKIANFSSGSEDPDDFWYNRISIDLPENIKSLLSYIFDFGRKKINENYPVPCIIRNEDVSLTVWKPAMSMHAHVDDYVYKDYNYAAVFYINDDYENGDIHFINFDKKVKPKANTLMIFPGHQKYLHEVKTITRKHRYTSAVWYQFDYKENE